VKTVVEHVEQVVPAVRPDGRLVDRPVDRAELDDVGVDTGRVEDEIVGLRQARLAGAHDSPSVGVEAFPLLAHFRGQLG